MANIPFELIDWSTVEKVAYNGEVGVALWQTMEFNDIRVRIVDYSANYIADHWCQKGHIVYCLEGEFESELSTGKVVTLKKGMSYVVSDNMSNHKSTSKNGAKLLIIDGHFLAP